LKQGALRRGLEIPRSTKRFIRPIHFAMQPQHPIRVIGVGSENFTMPYALFSNATKVSQSFQTKSEVWQHADESGLIVEVGSLEEDPPRRVLDMGYVIRECAADPHEVSAVPSEITEHEMSRMIAGCAHQSAERNRRIVNSIEPSGSSRQRSTSVM
jgi:hypothetical protein